MARYDTDGNGTVTLDEFTTTVPISRIRLLEYLHQKDQQRSACLSLPVTVLFFIWFVVLLSLHDVTNNAYHVETGVMKDMTSRTSAEYGSTFYTADTVDKLWDWLDTVLVPIAFRENFPGSGRPVPPYQWGTINSYNHYLGAGISIAQTRSDTDGCAIEVLDEPLNASCHPWIRPGLRKSRSIFCNAARGCFVSRSFYNEFLSKRSHCALLLLLLFLLSVLVS